MPLLRISRPNFKPKRAAAPASQAQAAIDFVAISGRKPVAGALLAALCGIGLPAWAQTASSDTAAVLPTVRVTAEGETASGPAKGFVAKRSATGTKTDTPLLETPQSVTVVTREQMDAQASDSLDQAFDYSAGISSQSGGVQRRTATGFTVRGFNITGSAPLYLNGSKFPINSLSGTMEPYSYERVELLKGPASILYGQTAPGGIINLVSKRPTAEPLREIELQTGSWNRRQIAGDFGGPIGTDGTFSYRLTGLVRESDTMIDPIRDDRTLLSGALDWKLSSDTLLTLLATYNKARSIYDYGKPLDGTLLPNINGKISRELFVGEPGFDKFDTEGSTLGYLLNHRINDTWNFRQNLLAFDYESDNANATSSLRVANATQRTMNRTAISRLDTDRGVSLDNQLVGQWKLGRVQHTLLMGLDWSERDFARTQRAGTATALNLFNPVYGGPITLAGATQSLSNSKQLGLYVQDQIKVDDRWIALLGGRYDDANNSSTAIAINGAVTRTQQKSSAFTPRAGLMYLADGGIAPYYSYSRSFQPTSGSDFSLRPFEPTTGTQNEIGVKYEPPGANASVTVAAYELTQQNVLTSDLVNPGFSVQTGEVRSRGVEVEGRASINRRLDLVGAVGTTDARITKSNTGNVGSRPTSVPRYTASLWTDYRFQEPALPGLSAGIGVRRVGPTEVSLMAVPAYTVYDAALRFQIDKWRFALNVKNLFNKTYLGSCSFACFYGDERNVTLSARYTW
ncbi:MAG: TonB-dependent siderophore receptor [Haliea sp.]|nr:MAG: TonB-dependent siderophore receptor [Haliea sp.]